jgi:ABC-type transport system substrate-binding protein
MAPDVSLLRDRAQSSQLSRRQLVQRAAAAGVAATALGTAIGSPAQAQDPGVLQLGRETEFNPVFLPFQASTGTQTQVFDLIFSRLLKVDADLNLVPDAAESFEVSPDATVFTFTIRDGMTWHDGEPFTIDDVLFTYQLALVKEVGAGQAGKLRQIKGAQAFTDGQATEIEGLERVDDKTLRITLELPNVAFLTGTALSNSLVWILPEHILGEVPPAELAQHPAVQAPVVGSGAYQFVEYVPDQHIEFKANPNFYLSAPKIEQVFLRLAEPATQLAQLESGELHLISRMAAREADRLQNSEILDIVATPGVGVFQTAVNNEWVTDKRVR